MLGSLIIRIDNILQAKACKSANFASIGKDTKEINSEMILLSNIKYAIGKGWTLDMLQQTECFIKKYE